MIIPNKHLSVNWTDGMKVNKEHFVQTENFIVDNLRDVASVPVNSYNFGFLPPLKGSGAKPSTYDVSKTATNQLQIRVTDCQAITPSGVRISIASGGLSDYGLSKTIDLASINGSSMHGGLLTDGTESFYVIIIANPFDRLVSGSPDPDEIPIRQPFTQTRYDIELTSAAQINLEQLGGYHLVIGRIIKNSNGFLKDESFIPPCSTITSSEELLIRYKAVGKSIQDIQNLSLQIVQKINYKDHRSVIAQNIKALCQTVIGFSNQHYFYFRNMAHQQSPVFIVSAISSFASIVHSFLQTMPEKEKEELLNYFLEWGDTSPVTFIGRLGAVVEIDYNHYQVGTYFNSMIQLLQNIAMIWDRLNTLEYIGQHKENIVVKEELVQPYREKKGWNILD